MRSGARSGSDGSSSVEAGRRVGTSVKSRLAQPPGSKACSAPYDLQYARAGLGALARACFKPTTQARDTDGIVCMEQQWLWAARTTSSRRKPSDSDRDEPSCVSVIRRNRAYCDVPISTEKYPKSCAVIRDSAHRQNRHHRK